jgi:hypothetical protein
VRGKIKGVGLKGRLRNLVGHQKPTPAASFRDVPYDDRVQHHPDQKLDPVEREGGPDNATEVDQQE